MFIKQTNMRLSEFTSTQLESTMWTVFMLCFLFVLHCIYLYFDRPPKQTKIELVPKDPSISLKEKIFLTKTKT